MLIHTPSLPRIAVAHRLPAHLSSSGPSVRTGMHPARPPARPARTGQGAPPPNGCYDQTAWGFQQACDTYPGPLCRRYYLPFASVGTVAPGATATIEAEPQIDMVPDEIVVPSTISPFFDIVSIVVGRTPQAASVGAVSAEIFSSAAFRSHTLLDPVSRGTTVSFTVTNTDAVAHAFRAAIFGAGNACN